eukprot:1199169-Heterocapsa_arctica.AAC.1
MPHALCLTARWETVQHHQRGSRRTNIVFIVLRMELNSPSGVCNGCSAHQYGEWRMCVSCM